MGLKTLSTIKKTWCLAAALSLLLSLPVSGGTIHAQTTRYGEEASIMKQEPQAPGEQPVSEASAEKQSIPDGSAIISSLKSNHPNQAHPRLMAVPQDVDRIKAAVATDPFAAAMLQQVKGTAQANLSLALPEYARPDGYRMPAGGRTLNEIRPLAMLYLLEGEQQYVDRAWAVLQAAGQFPDWNPQHFLDVGTMTQAFALAYDWMYDAWTAEQRDFIRDAIVEKGLAPALAVYRGEASGSWPTVRNNWNTVVNSSIAMGALAVGDDSPELEQMAGEILEYGLHSIQIILPTFAPDGGGEEGVGYWDYNVKHFVYYSASLLSALGTDYGLSEAEGVSKTAYFPLYMSGPGGAFNYSDSTTSLITNPVFFWFAKRFQDPNLGWYQRSRLETVTANELDLLWYDPGYIQPAEEVNLELDQVFRGTEAGSMRSAWNDPYAAYAGFKGGDNTFNHSNLDLGTFVMDALGVRWADDLGADNYNLPNYFNHASRTVYYRLRPEGQNTLVFNPQEDPGQALKGKAKLVNTGFAKDQAYMVADLSEAYAEEAAAVKRGMALIDHRRQFLLQDEITLKEPGEFFWFMHTSAQIDITDQGRTAILSKGDKRLLARIISDEASVVFEARDSVPLPTSPNPPGQAANPSPKLVIHGEDIEQMRLAVWFVPLMEGEPVPAGQPVIRPLDQWSVPAGEAAELTDIKLNGQSLPGFQADRFTYYVDRGSDSSPLPVIEAWAEDAQAVVTVASPSGFPEMAAISVQPAQTGARASEYRIYLTSSSELPVTASAHDGNEPVNTIDGNFNTRWSADGPGQWIQFRLDSLRPVNEVEIAFYNGDRRSTLFDIEASADGTVWTQVYSGQSSGTTSGYESFAFGQTEARYIRIVGYGNTSNSWNSISEVRIDGLHREEQPDRIAGVNVQLERSLLRVGQQTALQMGAQMQSGAPMDWNLASRSYYSLDPSIASVDVTGAVYGVARGHTRVGVEVKLDGYVKTAVAEIEVTDGIYLLAPAADTYVQGGTNAAKNFGSGATLVIKGDASVNYRRESYMQFDMSAVDSPATSVTLFVYGSVRDAGGTQATLAIYEALDSWQEKQMTWNTKPGVGGLLQSKLMDSTDQWHAIDLTAYAQGRQAADGLLNLALLQNLDAKGLGIYIHSRENEQKPYLRIVTEGAMEGAQ
ncbi:MAG: type protein [Paenibacillaceae bacterium]|jgi:hypothetical protein|nr:type protein [Paenibacillaceae bacterium]